ncbi:MAG: SPOR domain-containing protein [Pseudomonadota bacterium]
MAREPRKRTARSQPPVARFRVFSFLTGVVVGVGCMLLGFYLPELLDNATNPADTTPASAAAPTAPGEAGNATQETATASPKVRYEFHDLLANEPEGPRVTAYERAIESKTNRQYLLQSGSFLILADAERRRGEVLLLNLPAKVSEVKIDARIWYRVMVGPFAARADAQRAEATLKRRDIAALLLEQPLEVAATP